MKGISHPVFHGSIVALPTPFEATGCPHIDFRSLDFLIERQIESGSDGIVVGGSTGESTSLSARERCVLFEYAAGVARDRIAVIAGVGASDTRLARELTIAASRAGVTGLLATTPAYVRPTQEGLRLHFEQIATGTHLPIALYNIPSRTGVDLLPETASRIAADHPNVVAIKEASNSLDRLHALVERNDLAVLCGDDQWIADAIELGAAGVIGVVSNLVPGRVSQLVYSIQRGQSDDVKNVAPAIVESLAPLIRALFLESNPGPLKAAMEMMGLASERARLPLAPISEETRDALREVLVANGLVT